MSINSCSSRHPRPAPPPLSGSRQLPRPAPHMLLHCSPALDCTPDNHLALQQPHTYEGFVLDRGRIYFCQFRMNKEKIFQSFVMVGLTLARSIDQTKGSAIFLNPGEYLRLPELLSTYRILSVPRNHLQCSSIWILYTFIVLLRAAMRNGRREEAEFNILWSEITVVISF